VGYQLAASQRSDLKPPSSIPEVGHPAVLPPPEEFEATVHPLEGHYSRLLAFLDEGQFDRAADTLSIMKDQNGLNYKDTPLLEKRVVIHGLEEEAKRIPAGRIAENLAAYRRLLAMDPGNRLYEQKIALYEARRREFLRQEQDRDRRPKTITDQKSTVSAAGEPVIEAPF
jgi:hypothetical protein